MFLFGQKVGDMILCFGMNADHRYSARRIYAAIIRGRVGVILARTCLLNTGIVIEWTSRWTVYLCIYTKVGKLSLLL